MRRMLTLLEKKIFNVYLIWILVYLFFMISAGLFSYMMMFENLEERNGITTNMFKTILNQNSIQLISNPDAFQRVLVSDTEGQVLIQYGSLIPGLDTLNENPLFGRIKTENYAISDFYFDPVLKKVCFDIGLENKNRIYIGTITLDDSIYKFIGNVDLSNFIVLDRHEYGYLYNDNQFITINRNNDKYIHWLNSVLFEYNGQYYYYVEKQLGSLTFISFAPILKNILPLFGLFLIPFFIGFFLILFVRRSFINAYDIKQQEIIDISKMINSGEPVPENHLLDDTDLNGELYVEINQLLEKDKNNQLDSIRYAEKLSDYAEYLKGLRLNLKYVQRYFEDLQLKKNIVLEDSILEVFRMFFSESETTEFALVRLNDEEIFSCGKKTTDSFDLISEIIELGPYIITMKIAFNEKRLYDLKQNEIRLFCIFMKYLLYIHIIKNDEYTNELNSTKNFKLFSNLVSKEIHKANRYNLKGILACFVLENQEEIEERYGNDIVVMINESISAVLRSEIRKSDILGTYKEGFFLVYFYNFDKEIAENKIIQIVNKINIEEKIKQLGIKLLIKTNFSNIEKDTKSFETIFGKLLMGNEV